MADKYLERMSGALQENVLTLLCFDTEAARLIRLMVDVELFETRVYQDIASHAIAFLDQYGDAIKEHLPDELESKLESSDRTQSKLYKRAVENLYAAREHMNSQYITSQLQTFVHEQKLKAALLKAVESVESGNTAHAEVTLEAALKDRVTSFDVGTRFADPQQSLKFFSTVDDGIPIGIKELDQRGIMPSAGTMMLLIAPAKFGKSWFLTHVGKYATMQRKRVLHITLENSEELTCQRYVQSFFAISKRDAKHRMPTFSVNEQGRFIGVDMSDVTRPTLRDQGIRKFVEGSLQKRFKNSSPLIIKRFPTGTLTLSQYKAYLDQLERFDKFIPDVVLLDYPDLMDIASDNLRGETSAVFKGLRGVAVERNHALVTVTQGNRASAMSRTTTDTHVAEDYSKIATADTVLTYSRTLEEKQLGLARLFVSNARGDEDKFTTLITQSYALGQFALDSMPFNDDFWDVMEAVGGRRRVEDDGE